MNMSVLTTIPMCYGDLRKRAFVIVESEGADVLNRV